MLTTPIPALRRLAVLAAAGLTALAAAAQPAAPARFEGTLVVIGGQAQIEVANDEALASFFVEQQDADAARAQSLVNQRMAEASAQLKRSDPTAEIRSSGYSSYPVYRNDGGRKPVGWRVRQSLTLRTAALDTLARSVAAAQAQAALGGIDFRLSDAARQRLDAELIRRAIVDLNARVAATAQALGVPAERIRIEELNFAAAAFERPMLAMARAAPAAADAVAEPQFDPGRSTQQLAVTARVRFLSP